jgi:hypothetical protein
MKMSNAAEFRQFCESLTPSQVHAVYWKEKDAGRDEYAEIAAAVALSHGIHAELERVEYREPRGGVGFPNEVR